MFPQMNQKYSQTLEENIKAIRVAKVLEKKSREALSDGIKNRKNKDPRKEEQLSRLENLIKKAEYYNRIIVNGGLDAFSDEEREDYENTFDELSFLIP